MQISPKYRSIEKNSIKDRQKYFKFLQDQVNKSRMAVQTITNFKNTELNFKKKIDQIQQELHNSMSRMNSQTKKNVILKQIIILMKGEMFNFQKNQKQQQQKNQSEIQKKIKKVQYDIGQVLQKKNQEIAKINFLKESASSARSERVVFSNFFQKLQKQIKQNEEQYKESLIKSEVAKDNQKPIKPLSGGLQAKISEFKVQNNRQSQYNLDIFPIDSKFVNSNDHDGGFVTRQGQKSFQSQYLKKSQVQDGMAQECFYEFKNSSKDLGQKISCYENFIEKIKVFMGHSDVKEAVKFYDTVELLNQNLAAQIQIFNDEIFEFQNSIKQINLRKKDLECYQNCKELPSINKRAKLHLLTKTNEDNFESELIGILKQINEIVGLNISKEQFSDDKAKVLDQRLSLIMQQSRQQDLAISQAISHHRATTATTQSNALEILLQKMDRFNQCQKIFDRNLFQNQYAKQLVKNKKHKLKK